MLWLTARPTPAVHQAIVSAPRATARASQAGRTQSGRVATFTPTTTVAIAPASTKAMRAGHEWLSVRSSTIATSVSVAADANQGRRASAAPDRTSSHDPTAGVSTTTRGILR